MQLRSPFESQGLLAIAPAPFYHFHNVVEPPPSKRIAL